MAKIFIENEEIALREKEEMQNEEHIIEKNYYVMRSVIKTEFKASIFSYGEEKVLIRKLKRFNEIYFKFVLFDDRIQKAWSLIEISSKLEIRVRRLTDKVFIVVGDSRDGKVISQVSFCRMKPSTKVDEITINFTKLKGIHYLEKGGVVINFDDLNELNGKIYHTLASYNNEGVLQKTHYEYSDDDGKKYDYKIESDEVKISAN